MNRWVSRLVSFTLGVTLSIALLVPYLPKSTVTPYYNVRIHKSIWTEEGLYVLASFTKNGACKLETFTVLKVQDGIARYVPYKDLHGLPDTYDREEGDHSLYILIDVAEHSADTVEIRTRHKCPAEEPTEESPYVVVNKVFSTHTVGVNYEED